VAKGLDKELDKRIVALELQAHPPVDWEARIEKMEDTWKELYHKLVMDYADVKREIQLLRTILHTWLPIVEKDDNDMGGSK
jgi:hypothetical protein